MGYITIICLVLGLIGLVGFLKQLPKDDRASVLKAGANTVAVVAVYSAKTAKGAAAMSYNTGSALSNELQVSGQEVLNGVDEFNTSIKSSGGAARTAIKIHKEHADALGLNSLADSAKKWNKDSAAELLAKQQGRGVSDEQS